MDLNKFRVAVITMSDSRSKQLDKSGQVATEILERGCYQVVAHQVISDDLDLIKQTLLDVHAQKVDLIITTGGTGMSPRDNTPEATKAIIDKEVPGISEAMRHHSLQITPKAMLSRGISGIKNQTLIINLPGSPKAVRENLEFILPTLRHGIEVLRKEVSNCGDT